MALRTKCVGYKLTIELGTGWRYARSMEQSPVATPPKNDDSLSGLIFAVSAYFMWGFLPLYMKALAHVFPAERLGASL